MFKHVRTSNEKPAIINKQATTSSKSPKSILKSKNTPREGSRLYDEQLPTLISPSPAPQASGYKYYQDDAVTSETPMRSEGKTSDNDNAFTSKIDTPSSSDIESNEREVVEFTPTDRNPKEKSTLQKSKSLELNSSQAGRALETFKVFNKQDLKAKSNPAPSPKNGSKETEEATQKGLDKRRGRPRKRDNPKVGVNLDAGKAKSVEKPLTHSREKATNSQSQSKSVKPTSSKVSQPIPNTQVGSGSGIIIVKKTHE